MKVMIQIIAFIVSRNAPGSPLSRIYPVNRKNKNYLSCATRALRPVYSEAGSTEGPAVTRYARPSDERSTLRTRPSGT